MDQQSQPSTKLKLKLPSVPSTSAAPGTATPSGMTPAGSPPPQTPGGSSTKIKLVRKPTGLTPSATTISGDGAPPSAMPPPPAPSAVDGTTTTPAPKAPKLKVPKPPKSSPKKRPKPEDDDDDDVPLANGTSKEPQKKKARVLVIKTPGGSKPKPKTPTLKVKPIGKTPTRPAGICYDTEAEDKELDPVIEDQFILRMMEGEHLNYLKEHVQKKTIGVHKNQGGPDFSLKFLDDQGRRAVLTIQGQLYAAILLDLPTITEGMKSWDKKAMVKSADICQMMLVFAQVKDEEEAKTVPLPKAVEHGHRWPHGITPPMHDARKRRFRKRLSKLEVQNKEAEVERLLNLDKEAVSTKFEFIEDQPTLPTEDSGEEYEEEEEEEDADADGEVEDYFGDAEGDQDMHDQSYDDAALEAEFLDAFNEDEPTEQGDQPIQEIGGTDAVTPATANTGTPVAQTDDSGTEAAGGAGAAAAAEQEESGDDDEEEDADEDGDDDGMDDDGDEDRHDELAGVRSQIADLKKQLAELEDTLRKANLPIMRNKFQEKIRIVKSEIKLKQSLIGEADDD